ncbi:hypothetical protein LOC68_03560 [Blastopirellula sp. JC732]|uniref:MalT-like TPR region domain-containing protein n=1 Tax=Blastopirellula sediminis TaxID=2894196 RepID=A0A9X1SF62_9BACT|nr:hypothetical protein [Blastopirellula sediminis]MCC9607745.1 hypothetical protein [Blastopirellula sediminis]MCC9627462.1 hypothetical protein [Blastopirellula sediminis]
MMKASSLVVCCAVVVSSLACRTAFAQSPFGSNAGTSYRQQAILNSLVEPCSEGDFPKQLALLKEMRELTRNHEGECNVLSIAEIDFIMRDVELGLSFSPEKIEQFKAMIAKSRQAQLTLSTKDYASAVKECRNCVEISRELYGPQACCTIRTQISLANAISYSGENIEEGVAAVADAAKRLEAAEVTDYRIYGETQLSLTRLYSLQRDHEKAIVAGERTLKSLVNYQMQKTTTYIAVATLLADESNKLNRHAAALEYAMKGRVMSPAETGETSYYFYQLLLQTARANHGLQKRDETIREYSLLIFKLEQNSRSDPALRLECLKEYATVLDGFGDEDRQTEIQRKIERLTRRDDDPLEFTGEKSRYSN